MLGEFEFIDWIRRQVKCSIPVGIGDDCAVLPDGTLLTIDAIVEGVHFARGTGWYDVGWKACACNLSDIAAMGGRACYVVAVTALRADMTGEEAQEIVRGILAAAGMFGCELVGGDVVASEVVTVTIAAIGKLDSRPILRSGATDGDAILVTGALGGSLLGKHLRFVPRLAEARWLKDRGVHAMVDVSDGLLSDLGHILRESQLGGATLFEDRIPISPDAERMAGSDGRSPLEHALNDGEDFELLFTTAKEAAGEIVKENPFETPITIIGEVGGRGLRLRRSDGRLEHLDAHGYDHFRKS